MIEVTDREYTYIEDVFKSGEIEKSLKMQYNLIISKKCCKDILIDYRKKLYSTYIQGSIGINDNVIKMFKCAINYCTVENERLNIPFIKKAIYYLEQKNNIDYLQLDEWLNYYKVELLNTVLYENNKFTDRELYYLKKAKVLDMLNNEQRLNTLIEMYENEEKVNQDVMFFIKYHLCRILYKNRNFENARKILRDLLITRREQYILGLPIKYLDIGDSFNIKLYILELLQDKNVGEYILIYIYNWYKELKEQEILELIESHYITEKDKTKIIDIHYVRNTITKHLMKDKEIKFVIKSGKIVNITRKNNAFVSSESENIFVDKKYVQTFYKKGYKVHYIEIIFNNNEKGEANKNAVIIDWRK